MMKYLVILLSNQSTSFCHYTPSYNSNEKTLIPLEVLQDAIRYAFMEDLFIQFVLPSFALPKEYEDIIHSTKASIIAPTSTIINADVLVIEGIAEFSKLQITSDTNYVLRVEKRVFFAQYKELIKQLSKFPRLNIIFTDVEKFTDKDFELYKKIMEELAVHVKSAILSGKNIQINILTDRILQNSMNNCNAGVNTITLAPDGQFYICPAFYYDKKQPIGDLVNGISIKNKQLYKIEYAPLCRECDAFQCKRCVYLNQHLTREVNIPSREQCIMAHIERNASRLLLLGLREHRVYMPEIDIKEISYLDPFDNIKNK